MLQPLMVSIPHRLGRLEVRHRVDSGVGGLQSELSALLSGLDYHWEGDTLIFAGLVPGSTEHISLPWEG
jgi:hypothetical protein